MDNKNILLLIPSKKSTLYNLFKLNYEAFSWVIAEKITLEDEGILVSNASL